MDNTEVAIDTLKKLVEYGKYQVASKREKDIIEAEVKVIINGFDICAKLYQLKNLENDFGFCNTELFLDDSKLNLGILDIYRIKKIIYKALDQKRIKA